MAAAIKREKGGKGQAIKEKELFFKFLTVLSSRWDGVRLKIFLRLP